MLVSLVVACEYGNPGVDASAPQQPRPAVSRTPAFFLTTSK